MKEVEACGQRQKPLRVISREEAVFWMDGEGRWRNVHGRLEHPRIARRFHSSIRWDEHGFYLFQEHPDCLEKIYFPCEETALFAVGLRHEPELTLILNTGQEVDLEPRSLFIRGDSLYQAWGEQLIKFSARILVKLCPYLDPDDDQPVLRLAGGAYSIPQFETGRPDIPREGSLNGHVRSKDEP